MISRLILKIFPEESILNGSNPSSESESAQVPPFPLFKFTIFECLMTNSLKIIQNVVDFFNQKLIFLLQDWFILV